MSTDLAEELTTVYIARRGRRVLYVGITGRALRRLHAHARASAWWPQVSRIELRHLATRAAAEEVERELIREWRPPFNVVHVPREPESEPVPDPATVGLLDLAGLQRLGFPRTQARSIIARLPQVEHGPTTCVRFSDYLRFLNEHTVPARGLP